MVRKAARKTAPANTDSKSNGTRKRILDAAAQVLSTKGYAGMRLSEVAEVAGLQAPAIYYYFPSREDLIEEVMWAGLADMRQHMADTLERLAPESTAMERIMVAVEAHLRHVLEISDYATASIRNAGQVPDGIKKRHLQEEKEYGEIWRRLISDAVDDGAIRSDLDPYVAQMLVLGSLSWAVEWWTPKRGSVQDVVANAQSFVHHALSPA
jgi:AcrR family transcriptional regulator